MYYFCPRNSESDLMKVFKFGGGILHSAAAINKIPGIISMYPGEPLCIVVSALGKTTNALEELVSSSFDKSGDTDLILAKIKAYHHEILHDLFQDPAHPVFEDVGKYWDELRMVISGNIPASLPCYYDLVICFGELVSSKIVSHMLDQQGLEHQWIDIRTVLKTDSNYRDAAIDWKSSQVNADSILKPYFARKDAKHPIVLTQGFIGSDGQGYSTSLGREGSDYTAAILANLLNASEVITWKDVPGILNADPKHFSQTIKLDQISYSEATELAYYGAKVIHPKTVKPLQNKKIPLEVRSFDDPSIPGTLIHAGAESDTSIPNFIFKFDQVLISVSTRDLSFINEKVFADVFSLMTRFSIHMNIIQNSALTLSLCIDNNSKIEELISGLQENYTVRYNKGLELITIRHFNDKAAELVLQDKEVILEQQNRTVKQYVVR
jgi:aspartate kinase